MINLMVAHKRRRKIVYLYKSRISWIALGVLLVMFVGVGYLSQQIKASQSPKLPSGNDVMAPTIPAGLHAAVLTKTSIKLQWEASTDNFSVSGYHLYRNGDLLSTTADLSATDPHSVSGQAYDYTIDAYDSAGNVSVASSPVHIVTP